jgi:hypothetical protein
MNIRRIAALVWGLIVIVASNTIVTMPTASAESAVQSEVRFTPSQQQIVDRLKTANVVYLGETHDRLSDRQQQLAIIQALFKHNSQLAIGMEMFQRPAQPLLDLYLAGKITADELRQRSVASYRPQYTDRNHPQGSQTRLGKLNADRTAIYSPVRPNRP